MSEEGSTADLLRHAWNATTGDKRLDRLARLSLEMSASEQPSLAPTLASLKASGRTELDVHLDGPTVADHETAALGLGRFVSRASIAVKEVGKSVGGLKQLGARLQVLAPSAGSVRLVLRSPERSQAQSALAGTESDTIESVALRRVVALMLQAERAEGPDSPIEAALHGLRSDARRAVRLLAQSVVEGHWDVVGELRRGDGTPTAVRLSPAGAVRLAAAAKVTDAEEEVGYTVEGLVDGWVWSEATMTFIPDTGRRFRADVAEPLHAAVAHANDDPRPRVSATFTVIKTYPPGDAGSPHRSYELTDLQVLEEDPSLPF